MLPGGTDFNAQSPSVKQRLTWHPEDDIRSTEISVKRVFATAYAPMDAKRRNGFITLAYEDISAAFRELFGDDAPPTWFEFAAWSSDTVGHLMGGPIAGRTGTRALGYGNRMVFLDVAWLGASFHELFRDENADIDKQWTTLLGALKRPLPRPPGRSGLVAGEGGLQRFKHGPAKSPVPCKPPNSSDLATLTMLGSVHPSAMFGARGMEALKNALAAHRQGRPADRDRDMNRANLLLAAHEQRALREALTVSFRLGFRRRFGWIAWVGAHGPASFIASQRSWVRWQPPNWFMKLEDWYVQFLTMHVASLAVGSTKHRISDLQALQRQTLEPWRSVLSGFEYRKGWTDFGFRMAFISRLFANYDSVPVGVLPEFRKASMRGVGIDPELPPHHDPPPPMLAAQMADLRLHVDTLADDAVTVSLPPITLPADADNEFAADVNTTEARSAPLRNPETRSSTMAVVREDVLKRLKKLEDDGLFTREDLDGACDVFHKWQGLLLTMLLFRSLPCDYSCPIGAHVVGLHSALTRAPVRRSGQTATFLFDCFGPDVSWHDGDAIDSIAGLRMMHALVRSQVLHNSSWDRSAFGEPLSLEDIFGTMLSFVIPVFLGFDEFKFNITEAERDAYTRAWCALGHLLGVPLDVVKAPDGQRLLSYRQAHEVAETIWARQRATQPSLDGARLIEAMLEDYSDTFPRPIKTLPVDLLRTFGDKDVFGLLSVPRGHQRLQRTLRAMVRASALISHVPFLGPRCVRSFSGFVGARIRRYITHEHFGRPFRREPDTAPVQPVYLREALLRDTVEDRPSEQDREIRNQFAKQLGGIAHEFADWELKLLLHG